MTATALGAATLVAASTVSLSAVMPAPASAQDPEQPNIIIVLADDLGNADLGDRGSRIRTPSLDALARDGVRLVSCCCQQLCSAESAALMTGRHPMRCGLRRGVIFPGHAYGLPTEETTLPQALKAAGYATAVVGKWHLGHADRKHWRWNRGFDHFYGNLVGEVNYFSKDRDGMIDWQRNGQFLREQGYQTTQIGVEPVRLIEKQDTSKPPFPHVASLAAHTPLRPPQADVDAYRPVFANEEKQPYAAMISQLDTQVGRMVTALEKKGSARRRSSSSPQTTVGSGT